VLDRSVLASIKRLWVRKLLCRSMYIYICSIKMTAGSCTRQEFLTYFFICCQLWRHNLAAAQLCHYHSLS